jgi:hypothetical protein
MQAKRSATHLGRYDNIFVPQEAAARLAGLPKQTRSQRLELGVICRLESEPEKQEEQLRYVS